MATMALNRRRECFGSLSYSNRIHACGMTKIHNIEKSILDRVLSIKSATNWELPELMWNRKFIVWRQNSEIV